MLHLQNSPPTAWRILTPKLPILLPRSAEETWYLTPPWRYVMSSNHAVDVEDNLESWSDLEGSKFYRPLGQGANLSNAKLLVERHRDRGIGDHLFMTGPLAYMRHLSQNTLEIYWHAAADRSAILAGNQDLVNKSPLLGPVIYDCLPRYHYHWLVNSVSEYTEEPDQPNVYDALFQLAGVDPESVAPRWKRPFVYLAGDDSRAYYQFCRMVHIQTQVDLVTQPYWVVAPTCHSNLRSMPYNTWLQVIAELSKLGPVVVLGQAANGLLPVTDMDFGSFQARLTELSQQTGNVISIFGQTPARLAAAIVGGAKGLVTLDSGLLYVAQGVGTKAVSIWGPQDPATRLGYDPVAMKLAVWHKPACPASPCFAYRAWPVSKCPSGKEQTVCQVLLETTADQVMAKVELAAS